MGKALTPITTIASSICADLGDSNGRYKTTILRKLLQGWRELNLYVGQDFCVKTAVLNADNVVCLPDDFVMETKVGILKNGNLAVLSLDKSIQKQTFTDTVAENNLATIWNGGSWGDQYTFYNYYNNGGLGELYGYGGSINVNGFYNLNRSTGEIYIGSLMPEGAQIVVEYKSDGSAEGLTLVPTEMWNTLEYFAKEKWYADKDLSKAQYNLAAYQQSYNKLKRMYNFRSALFMANTVQSYAQSAPR